MRRFETDLVLVAAAAFLGGFVFPPPSDPWFWAGLVALVLFQWNAMTLGVREHSKAAVEVEKALEARRG